MTELDTTMRQEMEQPRATAAPRQAKPSGDRRRKLVARLLLVLSGTVLGLVLAEVVVRIGAAVMHRDPLIMSDRRMGWALRPNLQHELRKGSGGQYIISTDEEGHRITRPPGQCGGANDPTVVVLGDSYIYSMGANDNETFAWLLARDLPFFVVNLGVLGYGTDQELVCLETFLNAHPSLNIRDVVVFVTENDFIDVQISYGYLGRTKPRFQVEGGRLKARGLPAGHLRPPHGSLAPLLAGQHQDRRAQYRRSR